MIASQGSTSARSARPAALLLVLSTVAAVALLVRCVSIAQPLGIDQSLWASAVRGLARGQLLYQDVWEQRPPGIYWVYLAGFHVLGWTAATVAWLDVFASAATTLAIFAIGSTLSRPMTAATAAALYAVLTMPAWLYGHGGFLERSVSETFIVVCISVAAWCAARFDAHTSAATAAAVGFFAGAALLFKPNAGLYLPAFLLWMLWYRRGAPGDRRSFRRPLVAAALAALVMPAIAFLWLWQLDLLGEAKIAVVDFNRYYVGQGFTPAAYALDFSKAVWLRMKTDPLWLAGSVGAVVAVSHLARHGRLPPLAGLTVIWGATAALVIVVNGARLFNSYFIQALPPLSLLAAWMFAEWAPKSRPRSVVAVITAAVIALLLVERQYLTRISDWASADLHVLRGRLDRVAYLERFGGYNNRRGYSARANAELAAYVRDHTTPDDRIFLFGINGAGVYFAADRLTAQRFLRVNFYVATDFPDPRFRLQAVVDELAAKKPRYLIFERLHGTSEMARAADNLEHEPPIPELLAAYRFERRIEDFTLYRLND